MSKRLSAIVILVVISLLAPLLSACACNSALPATAYTALIPAVFQSGAVQSVSVALFAGENPTSGEVSLTLLKDGKEVAGARGNIEGNGRIPINIPDLTEGAYTLQIKGDTFRDEASITVENNFLVFLETDKPIYKPGQIIQMRIMSLNSELKPVSEAVSLEVLDAKGIKIFRTDVITDEFGMASAELPISDEPNLGTWKLTAATAKAKTQLDVKVEEYVLPKYEVKVDLPKDWFLVSEEIKGRVTATYSFGKPVKGELEIKATKYVGTWQQYADLKLEIDGTKDFTITPAQYVAGVPAAEGNGNVKLEFIVTEKSTGYREKTDSLLTVSDSSVKLSIIPSGSTFKPGLPFNILVISETPDNQLVDTTLNANISYIDKEFSQIKTENKTLATTKGKAIFEINPPEGAVALTFNCNNQQTEATKTIEAAYSPTGNFIHLEQTSEGTPKVGENINFWVYSTSEAANFYYEVISRGTVVYSDYVKGNQIQITATPAMAPSAKLLVYQILPNSEIAADYLPFKVTASYPQNVTLETGSQEARPGDSIDIHIQTDGESQVGLVAVDKSVFILAENRMNLQQVFDELEKLYMDPQAELHEVSIYEGIQNYGAQDVFKNAGLIVLSNKTVPAGQKYSSPMEANGVGGGRVFLGQDKGAIVPARTTVASALQHAPTAETAGPSTGSLAEVQRVRQYFPETWIWEMVKTDSSGRASVSKTVPDTITTWMLRAVALSKENGLGIAETQFKVFQPFFVSVDLPYSAIRGEEFPVNVAVYNYLEQSQTIQVEIQTADWFELLDQPEKTLTLGANDIGSAQFKIKPRLLGNANAIKITARSPEAADAVIKTLIIDAEGVAQEQVENISLTPGKTREISTAVPGNIVEGSARAYFAVTASYLTQTMDGLESLIQMPFGCGEQNMIIFAPDVYITKYLQESGQLKPEIMAKAEKLMLTGYQRELTYRRTDGSFSAFGMSDQEGSLWLTSFVMKCFAQAKGLIYIDDQVLDQAKSWILSHQKSDGSFEPVGFVHHAEMLGGLQGNTALTAYVAIALMQAGETTGSARAISYLEGQLNNIDDPYTLAMLAYALELAKSPAGGTACDKLMTLANEDENGLHWGSEPIAPVEENTDQPQFKMRRPVQTQSQTSAIENTAYALLALAQHGDRLNAGRAAKWLVSQRNAFGGFGSTQDTVMALEALVSYSAGSRSDVDLTLTINAGGETSQVTVNSKNFDVLQQIELPVNDNVSIDVQGTGEAIGQIVRRYNLPEVAQPATDILKVQVDYNADQVAVNDKVKVAVNVSFNPPEPMEAGMVVVDIAVPTGFAADKESIEKVLTQNSNIKRFDISGRKVIFYVENLFQGDKIAFEFLVTALYPVKAKGVTSQAYSYYQPEISAESLGRDITITEP